MPTKKKLIFQIFKRRKEDSKGSGKIQSWGPGKFNRGGQENSIVEHHIFQSCDFVSCEENSIVCICPKPGNSGANIEIWGETELFSRGSQY